MPEPDSTLPGVPSPADSNAAPVAESPDRSTPVLEMPNGEPLPNVTPLDVAVTPDRCSPLRGSVGATEKEILYDALAAPNASASIAADTASNAADLTSEHALNVRRVQEFSAEPRGDRRIREWDGAAHEGTVVAADAGGVVMHVGRNEYMRVPSQASAVDQKLVGSYAVVDRSGRLSTDAPAAREGSRSVLDRGGR